MRGGQDQTSDWKSVQGRQENRSVSRHKMPGRLGFCVPLTARSAMSLGVLLAPQELLPTETAGRGQPLAHQPRASKSLFQRQAPGVLTTANHPQLCPSGDSQIRRLPVGVGPATTAGCCCCLGTSKAREIGPMRRRPLRAGPTRPAAAGTAACCSTSVLFFPPSVQP